MSISNMRFRLHKLIANYVGAEQFEQIDRGEMWLDEDLRVAFLKCDLTFIRAKDRILTEGVIETSVEVQCVRSLNLFYLPITTSLEDVAYAVPGQQSAIQEGLPRIDNELWVDVSEQIRDAIIMALPINPISPEYQSNEALGALIDDSEKEWLTIKWSNGRQ
ncbi:MAG: DUF177 domain-containing protein [Anaerolineae bacterium]|nr:DUF177 domain-containing protein [Anaerolineae bacterium]